MKNNQKLLSELPAVPEPKQNRPVRLRVGSVLARVKEDARLDRAGGL